MTFFLLYWKYIAAAAAIALLTVAYNVHVDGLIDDAVTAAVTENNGKWQDSEQKAIVASRAKAAEIEENHRKELAAQAAKYEKERADDKAKHDKDIAAVRSGAIRLRDAAATCASAGNDPKPSTAPSGSDGPKGADLSGSASEFLLSLANEADDVVKQLTACQQVILSDRKEAASP